MSRRRAFGEHRNQLHIMTAGSVVIRDSHYPIHGCLLVMSGDRLEVECEPGVDLRSLRGARVDVDVRVAGPGGGWLQFRGRVMGVRLESHSLVIAAAEIPPEFAGVIEANLVRPEPELATTITVAS